MSTIGADARLDRMTAREKVHMLVDELPESELGSVAEILASRGEGKRSRVVQQRSLRTWEDEWGEPETVGLPESLMTFDDGTPQPDWMATLDEIRRER